MTSGRIIRARAEDSESGDGLELDLNGVEALGRRILREAMDRVEEARSCQGALEEETRRRREDMDREFDERRGDLEARLQEVRDAISGETESIREKNLATGPSEAREDGFSRGHREGFERGYADGRSAGHREAHADESARLRGETGELTRMLQGVAREVSRNHDRFLKAVRRELVRLAVKVAERVVQREVGRDVEAVLMSNLSRAVDLVFQRRGMRIELNPADLHAVQTRTPESLKPLSDLETFELSSCHDVERGGCRIVTGSGVVDRTFAAQLEVIEKSLLELDEEESVSPSAARSAEESVS